MEYKVNFHTHTYRCKHAIGTERDYVNEAINKNLTTLGFSDHSPYPDERFGYRMDYCQLNDYLNKIENLKEEFKNKLNIYSGLEIEYDANMNSYYEYLLNDLKVVFLHFLCFGAVSIQNN